jgi:hypothetical protein
MYQQRIAAKPYVPATTLGASGFPNKLVLVFWGSEHDVGVQFLNPGTVGN